MTTEERYKAATDYVRRAIDAVEAIGVGYVISPVTGLAEWYAGKTKTAEPKSELRQIEARWLRASTDAQRTAVAREAELLADRVEENLPGAPQDWTRTNLYAGEVAHGTPATSYGQELAEQADDAYQWTRTKLSTAADTASSIGKWALTVGGALLAWKGLDYLAARERAKQSRAAKGERRALNTELERVAERGPER